MPRAQPPALQHQGAEGHVARSELWVRAALTSEGVARGQGRRAARCAGAALEPIPEDARRMDSETDTGGEFSQVKTAPTAGVSGGAVGTNDQLWMGASSSPGPKQRPQQLRGVLTDTTNLWHPTEGFDVSRDLGVGGEPSRPIPSVEGLAEALAELAEAELEAVATVQGLGAVPGPTIDVASAIAREGEGRGFGQAAADEWVNGVAYPARELPPAYEAQNYASIAENAVAYIKELTRLVRKFKLLPIKRRPWSTCPTGFVVTQGGAKVRLVVDFTATGHNAALEVPYFRLPTVDLFAAIAHEGDYLMTADVSDMFLSFRLTPEQVTMSGIRNEFTGHYYAYPWVTFGNSAAPAIAARNMTRVAKVATEELRDEGLIVGDQPEATAHTGDWRADPWGAEYDGPAGAARPPLCQRACGEELSATGGAPAAAATPDGDGRPIVSHTPLTFLTPDETRRAVSHRVTTGLLRQISAAIAKAKLDVFVTYVDDFGFSGHPDHCRKAYDIVRRLLNVAGLDFKESKTVGPAQRLTFLSVGLQLSEPAHFYLEDQRRLDLLQLLDEHHKEFRQLDTAPLTAVRKIVGKITWSAVAYSAGYTYARRMWDVLATAPLDQQGKGSKFPVELTADYWQDVAWWRQALQHPAWSRLYPRFGDGRLTRWDGDPRTADVVAATDAADDGWGMVVFPPGFKPLDVLTPITEEECESGLAGGAGGTWGIMLPPVASGEVPVPEGQYTTYERDAAYAEATRKTILRAELRSSAGERRRGRWAKHQQQLSINWKELKTVEMLCTQFGAVWKGQRVLVRVDNETAVSYVNKGYGSYSHLTAVARRIKQLQAKHGFTLRALYVTTRRNTVADGLSRFTVAAASAGWNVIESEFKRWDGLCGPFAASGAMASDEPPQHGALLGEEITGRTTWWTPAWVTAGAWWCSPRASSHWTC